MAEVSFCYTDNILAPKYEKYSLDYYLKLAKQLEAMGCLLYTSSMIPVLNRAVPMYRADRSSVCVLPAHLSLIHI